MSQLFQVEGSDSEPVLHPRLDTIAMTVVTVLPVVGLAAAGWLAWGGALRWHDLFVLVATYVPVGLGISVGYHRLFTHRAFKANPIVRAVAGALGSAALEGPVISWVANHRKHHAFTDCEGDPHSPHVDHGGGVLGTLRGLWHAHMPAPLPGRPRRRAVSRSCARRRPKSSPACSGPTYSGSPPSPTATGCARRSSRRPAGPSQHHSQHQDHHSICKHGREEPRMTLPTETAHPELEGLGTYEFGWADSDAAGAAAKRGLSEAVVRDISAKKNEPEWMLKLRLKGLKLFGKKPMPNWGSDLSGIDFDNIKYFVRSTEKQAESWEDLPEDIKNTYDKLGIPEAEKQRLVAGVAAQYESEVVYHQIREDLEEQGVSSWTPTPRSGAPGLFEEYFGTVIPVGDNKFASLNTAVWSGGSLIYVPKGVHVDIPLQAYFRINTENMGQFERTLIIVDEDAYVHYVEGCTAPIYKSDSLHSAVVEIIVKKGGRCRYTTIQNWSNNVYNLVTKRAVAYEGATMEWVDGNLGSKVTMKYPAVYLMGEHAKGETLSIAFAGEGQHQDAGSKMVHMAPNTSSDIVSKSVARGGGRTSYRGLVEIGEGAAGSSPTCSATPCWSTPSPARTPTRTSTSARTTCPWVTRRPSRRSARTSSST